MKAFESQVHIDRPVPDVWRELTGWVWLPEVVRHDGATVTFRARGRERTSAVTEVTPGTAVTVESVQGAVTARYAYRLEPVGEGTRVSLVADVVTRRSAGLLGPLVRAVIRHTDRTQLEKLREVAEALPR